MVRRPSPADHHRLAEAVETAIAIHREGWKDAGKSEKQWRASLRDYAMKRLGRKRVDRIPEKARNWKCVTDADRVRVFRSGGRKAVVQVGGDSDRAESPDAAKECVLSVHQVSLTPFRQEWHLDCVAPELLRPVLKYGSIIPISAESFV